MTIRQQIRSFRSSFQYILLRHYTILTGIAMFVMTLLYAYSEYRQLLASVDTELHLVADILVEQVRIPLYADDNLQLEQVSRDYLGHHNISAIEIYDANNRKVIGIPAVPTQEVISSVSHSVEIYNIFPQTTSATGDPANAPVSWPLIGRIKVYRNVSDIPGKLQSLVVSACIIFFSSWLLISVCSYLLLRRVTASFQSLMGGLQEINSGNYTYHITQMSDDEIGQASSAVNSLAGTLLQRERENASLTGFLSQSAENERISKLQLASANKLLEVAIEESRRGKQEITGLLEQLPVGIVWTNQEGRIEFVNRFVRERLGYGLQDVSTLEELLGCICSQEEKSRILEQRSRFVADQRHDGSEVVEYDFEATTRDGRHLTLFCQVRPLNGRFIDSMVDVTYRKLLQEQLVNIQKLESLGVLAAGVSHNFNNIVTGIRGYLSYMRSLIPESHAAYPALRSADNACQRATLISKQLGDVTRGSRPMRLPVKLDGLIRESIDLTVSGTSTNVALTVPAELWNVLGDEGQLLQVFNCLLLNAVQAMPHGGTITITGTNVSSPEDGIPVQSDGDYVQLSVTDQGNGIAEQDKSSIFTPFFSTKADVGSGLGLTMVHTIVTRHGGAVLFDSRVGEGTTFTLYLPAAKQQSS